MKHTCCICGKVFEGFGNNPYPLVEDDSDNLVCCDECNNKVIVARLAQLQTKRCPYCNSEIIEQEFKQYGMCKNCQEDEIYVNW